MPRKKKETVEAAREVLTEVPAPAEVLTEVPPILDETSSETVELLTEVPDEPIGTPLLEETEFSHTVIGNHFTGDFAPAPNPRQPRAVARQKVSGNQISLDSLTPKQKKALLGGFSKKTLSGRFGIKCN